jgi:hypothetical protein
MRKSPPPVKNAAPVAAKASPAIKTVLELAALVDRLPSYRRGVQHDEGATQRYTADVAQRLARAVRDVLTPSFIAWATEREATARVAPVVDDGPAAPLAGTRYGAVDTLRRRLAGFHTEGDRRVFAVTLTAVDVLLHPTHDGEGGEKVYNVSHVFRAIPEGAWGSYGGDASWQCRRGPAPVIVGAMAEALWDAMQGCDGEVATRVAVAELSGVTADHRRAPPAGEDDAAAWNVETAATVVKLREAAAQLRGAASTIADQLDALAGCVGRDTWPKEPP